MTLYNQGMDSRLVRRWRPTLEGCMIVPNIAGNWDIVDFVRQAHESGFAVESRYLPEEGLKGYVASKRSFPAGRTYGPVSLEAYFLCYPIHGVPLVPMERTITVKEWVEQCELHRSHVGFAIFLVPSSLQKKMVCCCRASEGISLVFKVDGHALDVEETRMETLADDIISIMMDDENQ